MNRTGQMEKWFNSFCIGMLKLIHQEKNMRLAESMVEFVKFGIIGVSNTAISYFLNVIVLKLLQPRHVPWDFIAANIVAFFLSVMWSFYWNSKFVFKTKNTSIQDILAKLLRTYIAYGFTGIVLNNILSWLWIEIAGISKYIAPLINLIISVPLNFIINKFWAFKKKI